MKLKRTYWLKMKGNYVDGYFHVVEKLDSGNLSGYEFLYNKRDKTVIPIYEIIEIDVSNLPKWKHTKKPSWSP